MDRICAIMMILCIVGCATTQQAGKSKRQARVTFYNPFERDRVLVKKGKHRRWRWITWGRRTSSGARAKQGVTVAAPPWIPFGTKVKIPQLAKVIGPGPFVVQDRGAGHKLLKSPEWFDIFVDNKSTMKLLASIMPPYLEYELQ